MVGLLPMLIGFLGGTGMQMGMAAPPVGRTIAHITNAWFPNLLPDLASLVDMRRRNLISPDQYFDLARKQGADRDVATWYYDTSIGLVDLGSLILLKRRGQMPGEVFYREASKLGYDAGQVNALLKASEYFPSPIDLVRFAVREVYSPEIRERYGMDEDYPKEFEKEAAKTGLPAEQAKNYWAAHWELPSISMGYEMLHRGKISEEDLDTLLRAQDVMPFWREGLKAISYAPFTRVDVRRMYRDGVLTRDEVVRAYMDIGYDSEKAEKLTEWTVAEAQGSERDLTQAMVLEAYEQGELTREETHAYLVRLRYDEAEAELVITLRENDLAEKEQKEEIQAYQAMYKNGAISADEFRTRLDELNLRASYRAKILHSTIREKTAAAKLPTRADLEEWLIRGVITTLEYADEMTRLGYRERDIQRYLASMKKLPTRAELEKWYRAELIDGPTWTSYMEALGYRDEEIAKYWQAMGKHKAEE